MAFFLIGGLALVAGPLIILRIFLTVGEVILTLVGIGILGTWLLAQGVDEIRSRISYVELSSEGVTLDTNRGSVTVEWSSSGLEIDLYDYRGRPGSRFHSLPCGIRVRTGVSHIIAGISTEAFEAIHSQAGKIGFTRVTPKENAACCWFEIRDAWPKHAES